MKVEMMSVSAIIPYARNPRKNDKAVKVVARRIREVEAEGPELLRRYDAKKVRAESARSQYKNDLRAKTADNIAAINALTTIEAVRDYKPVWPAEPGE